MHRKHYSLSTGLALTLGLIGSSTLFGELAEPKFGTPSEAIGTFAGWTGFVGWEASFSDTYAPVKEKYAWVVYFAPEAIYLALEASMAVYSAVDVNMGYKYFYGFLKSENADPTLTKDYREKLWAVSISREVWPGFEGAGPLAQLSMGMELEQGFFRVKNTKTLIPGYTQAASFSVAYSLLPFKLPFKVELDVEWDTNQSPKPKTPFSGFWPIVMWKRPVAPDQSPVDQISAGLQELARNGGVPATTFAMAGMLAPMMQQLSEDQDLRAFFANPRGSHRIGQTLVATETWLQTGDTGNVPTSIVPEDEKKTPEVVKPVLVGTQLAFETGYRVGAQANPNNKTIYVDGVVTNYCYIGEKCRIEVKAQELSSVISNTVPANFARAWIGFTKPIEYSTSHGDIGQIEWIQMTNGVAQFTLTQSFTTPQMVGVTYSDQDSGNWNQGHNVELKRHLLIFLDPTDANHNGIPDFWESQYSLTNWIAGADSDHDGMTDHDEFIADTSPTNRLDFLKLTLTPKSLQKLTIPFTSSARRYTIEGNTNSALLSNQWFTVEDFFGEDAASDVDITRYLKATNALFRLKVSRY